MSRELIYAVTRRDLRIDYFSGTGKGGQHRNKHQNCVRITHPATGIAAQCTEHRERSRNLQIAFRRLAEKLVRHLQAAEVRERYAAPSEYVRTYHAVENRVVDHKTGQRETYAAVLFGNALDALIAARAAAFRAQDGS